MMAGFIPCDSRTCLQYVDIQWTVFEFKQYKCQTTYTVQAM